jgi:hypothetical protein
MLAAAPGVEARRSSDPCVELPAINQRCPVWSGTHASAEPVPDVPKDVVAGPAATYTFGQASTATGLDWTLVANDAATGALRWTAAYRGPDDRDDVPETLTVDGDRVFAVGTTCAPVSASETCDLLVAAFDAATGVMLWDVTRDGPGQLLDWGSDLAVSPDGTVLYVAGTESGTDGSDAVLLALDPATGDLLWRERYDGGGGDNGWFVAVSDDGRRVFLVAASAGSTTGTDYATAAWVIEEEDGAPVPELLWAARHDDHLAGDTPGGIVVEGEHVIVTGGTEVGVAGNYNTVAYDQVTGEQAWSKLYNGGTLDVAVDIVASHGAVFVTGMSRGTNSGYDMATVAYDAADGDELWASRYNGPGQNGDAPWAIDVSPDGGTVYVGGDSVFSSVDYLHAVIAYDTETGAESWVGLHRGAGPGGGTLREGLDVSPDGARVFFTGRILTLPDQDMDFLTLAYDA